DQQRRMADLGQGSAQVDGGGGLADAALLVDHRDDGGSRYSQHVGPGLAQGSYIWCHGPNSMPGPASWEARLLRSDRGACAPHLTPDAIAHDQDEDSLHDHGN